MAPPVGAPPGGGAKGLCSSRICTPENPATSTRLTKDTRGLRCEGMLSRDGRVYSEIGVRAR